MTLPGHGDITDAIELRPSIEAWVVGPNIVEPLRAVGTAKSERGYVSACNDPSPLTGGEEGREEEREREREREVNDLQKELFAPIDDGMVGASGWYGSVGIAAVGAVGNEHLPLVGRLL